MKISEILERLYWSSSDSNSEWEYKEFVYEALDEIAKHLMGKIPNDYKKSKVGIGGDLNICEYCNRPYDSCRCNEVYNKALADIRKILNEEFK